MSHTYRIAHPDADLSKPTYGMWADIANCASPMAAVELAAKCYTWARGYIAFGSMWPFDPLMLVDGIPAYRVAANEFGGSWIDGADRIEAALAQKVAA